MHSTDQQLFIPPGLRIIHIYASESRLFSRVAAVLQASVRSHLLHRAQCISMSGSAEGFSVWMCLPGNRWRRMAKTATQRQKVLIQQAHEHKMWKSSRGLHGPWWCHQRGPAEVSSKWKEPRWYMVKATLTDVLPPAAKKSDNLGQFPLFSLFF